MNVAWHGIDFGFAHSVKASISAIFIVGVFLCVSIWREWQSDRVVWPRPPQYSLEDKGKATKPMNFIKMHFAWNPLAVRLCFLLHRCTLNYFDESMLLLVQFLFSFSFQIVYIKTLCSLNEMQPPHSIYMRHNLHIIVWSTYSTYTSACIEAFRNGKTGTRTLHNKRMQ